MSSNRVFEKKIELAWRAGHHSFPHDVYIDILAYLRKKPAKFLVVLEMTSGCGGQSRVMFLTRKTITKYERGIGGLLARSRYNRDAFARLANQDEFGGTPLHWAVRNRDQKKVKTLIKAGFQLDLRNNHSRTPLMEAVRMGDARMAMLLHVSGAGIFRNDAAWKGIFKEIRRDGDKRALHCYKAALKTGSAFLPKWIMDNLKGRL